MGDMSVGNESSSNSVDSGVEESGFDAGLNEDVGLEETVAEAGLTEIDDTFETAPAGDLFGAAEAGFVAEADATAVATEVAALQTEPPNPQEIIDAHKNGLFNLNLDEAALGETLANEYAMNGDYETVTAVIDELAGRNQDDVARAFVDALSDDQLAEIASTDAGLDLVKELREPVNSGVVTAADRAANARLETAFYSNEGHFGEIMDRAALSADIYNDSGAPEGWSRLNDAGLPPELAGLPWSDEQPGGSGFHAALYQSDEGEVVLVFEGTNGSDPLGPDGRADWSNNLQQGLGLSSQQYSNAIEIAQQVQNVYGDDFVITGHSLGGGLAAAAGTIVGVETTTFNAAGVNPNTLAPFGLTRDDARGTVEAFHVDGEVLNGIQDSTLQKGVVEGLKAVIPVIPRDAHVPEAAGDRFTLPAVDGDAGAVDLHGMPHVVDGLETKRN
ncbi:MAG: hypothetical protein AAF772_09895 [Acidobacteriota bacterium]